MEPNILGAYGPWAASLVGDGPARLSYRQPRFRDLGDWKAIARARYLECLMPFDPGPAVKVEVEHQYEYDGLHIEHLRWQLPYGPPTEAYFLKPKGAKGPLPAILGLHDHGGNKAFGFRKITKVGDDVHPVMKKHHDEYYGGRAWANEIARRGYAVLVHDTFAFASRQFRLGDLPGVVTKGLREEKPDSEAEIKAYNTFAGQHENLIAKSLFCAGTSWPAVFLADDRKALDILCARPDVDAKKVGCAGLSGGGLRTVYLTGADERIAASCCVGMMTTWRDYMLNKSYTHTWMIYIPGLPQDLDYPEILGLRPPTPVLVQNNNEDSLFTLPEMKRADGILKDVYAKAGAADRYRASFYPGPHKFDLPMQAEAFEWFDRWLK